MLGDAFDLDIKYASFIDPFAAGSLSGSSP